MKNIPYSSSVGSCMYAMISTFPYIAQAVSLISRFMSKPGKQHWEVAKWLVRYIKESMNLKMMFKGSKGQSCRISGYL